MAGQSDWEVMGLEPEASIADIKTAFRARVKELHPDLRPRESDAEAKLKQLVAAYHRLLGQMPPARRVDDLFARKPVNDQNLSSGFTESANPGNWFAESLLERVHQAFQCTLVLSLMLVPIATLWLAAVAFTPGAPETPLRLQPMQERRASMTGDENLDDILLRKMGAGAAQGGGFVQPEPRFIRFRTIEDHSASRSPAPGGRL